MTLFNELKDNPDPDSSFDRNQLVQEANRNTLPWSITGGTDYNLFVQQRELATDNSAIAARRPQFHLQQLLLLGSLARDVSHQWWSLPNSIAAAQHADVHELREVGHRRKDQCHR